MIIENSFFVLISETLSRRIIKYIMSYDVIQNESKAAARDIVTLTQLRGANSNLIIAGNKLNRLALMDWTTDMQVDIDLVVVSDDPTHCYASKAVANQIAYTTWTENIYFSTVSATAITLDSTIVLGTGNSPSGLAAVEPVAKLIVFYEFENIYYIVDEGAGHAKQAVASGVANHGAVYMHGF